ncbi:MAG TPA: ABC transporter permease, partial [Bryobacteraceae bacterium]|nr:ABC transporter permease [Bryobacteraceae bacterium]
MWSFLAETARRISYLLNRRKLDAQLADEMAAHAEMRGSAIGNTLRLREESRDAWGWLWLDRVQQDARYAFRTLRKSPGFVATSVFILALGIGVNLALFQLFDLVALRPVRVRDAATLVQFTRASPVMSSDGISYPATQFYKTHNNVLTTVVTTMGGDAAWQDDASDRVRVRYVSANYFTEVGYHALAGRLFVESVDGRADAAPVAIVSDKFWQKRFANTPELIGQTVRINDRPAVVIGVTPEPFPGLKLDSFDVYLLIHQTPHFNVGSDLLTNWSTNSTTMYGRMRPGLSVQAVKDGFRPQVTELAKIYPDVFHKDEYLNVSPLESSNAQRDPEFQQAILLGFALTALMLIAACANLSNLNLSRAQARHRELAIRASLGAGRWRVVRQLMTESLLIGLAGAALGLVVGQAAMKAVLRNENMPINIDMAPSIATILVTVALAIVASVLVGLLPAMRASRGDLAGAMKEAATQATSGAKASRFRYALIGTQIAACTVFLIVAFSLTRNVQRLLTEHPGFDYGSVAVAEPSLQRYGLKGAAARDYWNRFTALVKAHPEVTAVSLVENAPLGRRTGTSDYNDAPGLRVYHHSIDESFFQVMRIPLITGRTFTSNEPSKDVVIISQALARRMYDSLDVVGRG